jgi:outer membrane beta-barrel protein
MRTIIAVLLLSLIASTAQAAPRYARGATQPEKADVGAIKEKYWTKGDETELGVVQDRLYKKSGKLELGGFAGLTSNDPFLNIKQVGGSVGFHLSELWAVHAVYWKNFVKPSSALETFQRERGATTNTNEPESFYGGEVGFSPIYGKLSLLGKSIIYYDFHLLGGAGLTKTETGTYLTPLLGLGQQIWVSDWMSIRIDYRLMTYKEDIKEKVIPTQLGQVVDTRQNWSNTVTLGVTFLIGG